MPNDGVRTSTRIPVRRGALLLLGVWTLLLGGSLAWNIGLESRTVVRLATIEATAYFNKDAVYRRWAALHGGVYAPVAVHTRPNPYLAHLPERDITTPSGRRLTLINPAYMTRQVEELSFDQYGVRSHITSLRPLRPGNAPDDWEKNALEAFEKGAKEVSSYGEINGELHLRFMRPFYIEQGCLQCHAAQGYRMGEVRGGISMSVPLARHYALRRAAVFNLAAWHLFIYLFGAAGILFGARLVRSRVAENIAAHENLELDRERFRSLLALSRMKGAAEEELIAFGLEEIVRLTGSSVGYFHYFDESLRTIRLSAWSRTVKEQCFVPGMETHYPLDRTGVWADCIRQRRPVVQNDYPGLPEKAGCPNGHVHICRHLGVPVIDGEEIVAIAGVGNKEGPYDDGDVTQLSLYTSTMWEIIRSMRAEETVRKKEMDLRLFRELIDQSYDSVFVVSPDDARFIDVNQRACDALGYSREELLRLRVFDIDSGLPEGFDWKKHIRELREKPYLLLVSEHKRKDGSVFPVEINIRILAHGDREYMISVARDITERRKTEAELTLHREHLERLVAERTRTLEAKTMELERFNRLFVDREFWIKELKEKVQLLEGK